MLTEIALALYLLQGKVDELRVNIAEASQTPPNAQFYANAEVLERLAECESGNNPKAINPRDPITPSFGLYQFKISTFRFYGEKHNIIQKNLTDEELRHWIMFGELQTRIADKMLSEKNGWKHWRSCLK